MVENDERLLDAIEQLTRRMAEAARVGEWEQLEAIEGERAGLIQHLPGALQAHHRGRLSRLLDLNEQVTREVDAARERTAQDLRRVRGARRYAAQSGSGRGDK